MSFRKNLSPGKILILTRLAAGFIRLVGKTSRWEFRGSGPVWKYMEAGQNQIFAFWHNRFIMMPYIYCSHFHKNRIAVIVSRSRDGELVGGVIERFGFLPIRGSSSRGGKEALLNLSRLLKEKWDVAITPDGPRGPRYHVQDGIISLAASSGAPIIPVSYASTHQFKLSRSWDHMRIPLPGGRISIVFGPPLQVQRGNGREGREFMARELKKRLRRADFEAESNIRRSREDFETEGRSIS